MAQLLYTTLCLLHLRVWRKAGMSQETLFAEQNIKGKIVLVVCTFNQGNALRLFKILVSKLGLCGRISAAVSDRSPHNGRE